MINWTELIIGICGLIITYVAVPWFRAKRAEAEALLSKEQQATIDYWVKVGVHWAKQYMWTEEGQAKKAAVMEYTSAKLQSLGINVSTEDLDKIIEAVYNQIQYGSPELIVGELVEFENE